MENCIKAMDFTIFLQFLQNPNISLQMPPLRNTQFLH